MVVMLMAMMIKTNVTYDRRPDKMMMVMVMMVACEQIPTRWEWVIDDMGGNLSNSSQIDINKVLRVALQ